MGVEDGWLGMRLIGRALLRWFSRGAMSEREREITESLKGLRALRCTHGDVYLLAGRGARKKVPVEAYPALQACLLPERTDHFG